MSMFVYKETTSKDTGIFPLRLRIVEAYEIQTRRPTLNRKQEDLGTGFLAWRLCDFARLYTHAVHPC